MGVERIVVDGLGRLPQFAHAGVADDWVHVSGTLGTLDDGLGLADGIGAQTTRTLENIGRILAAVGASWDDVVKVNVFLVDMAEFGAMNEAYGAFFDGVPPARITAGATALALGARVEMDCIARRPPAPRRDARPGSSTLNSTLPRRVPGFVDFDGERLYFEDCGPEDAPVLVLCHGAGGNHAIWFQQVVHFARTRRVVTWDHRGYGRSTDRADQSGPVVAATDLLAILDHLGVGEADLVGQSMGGWSAVGAALARPEVARSLVLADTLGGFTSDSVVDALTRPRSVEAAPLDAGQMGLHPALDTGFSARHPERAHLYQSIGAMGTADATTIIGRLMETSHDAEEARLITCPVLAIVGDRDPLFPPEAVRAVTALLPDARVVEIPGCGHSPYFEAPTVWNAIVAQFLDSVSDSVSPTA